MPDTANCNGQVMLPPGERLRDDAQAGEEPATGDAADGKGVVISQEQQGLGPGVGK